MTRPSLSCSPASSSPARAAGSAPRRRRSRNAGPAPGRAGRSALDHAAHASAHRRNVRRPHGGVGDDDHVAREPVAVARSRSAKFGEPDSSSPSMSSLSVTGGAAAPLPPARRWRRARGTAPAPCRRTRRGRAAARPAAPARTSGIPTPGAARPAGRRDGRRRAPPAPRVARRPLGIHRRKSRSISVTCRPHLGYGETRSRSNGQSASSAARPTSSRRARVGGN